MASISSLDCLYFVGIGPDDPYVRLLTTDAFAAKISIWEYPKVCVNLQTDVR